MTEENEMIVGDDRRHANLEALPICEGCGWYASKYTHRCDPAAGRIASALARAFPEGNPTKLGYGDRTLVFELDEYTHIRFEIGYDRSISLREVWHVGDLGIDQAEKLVRAIREALAP